MAGPFPGMDPYLEEPSEWPDLHSRLITTISDTLAAAVAPAYIVRIEQRVYTTSVELVFDLEMHDLYIEIHDAQSSEVVTTIEIISPFNKVPGSIGREQFLRKRRAVMSSPAHWIEIDLLRAGERPPEVTGQSGYYALLNRGGSIGPFEVWYANLRDALPTIAVPLRPPHADVPLGCKPYSTASISAPSTPKV